MMIHEITEQVGKYKARKRVGRGLGSGHGRRSGRGQKGAGSRSGTARKTGFEGGQMPYFRRLRKFGFSNANFTTKFWIVNLRAILVHPQFAKGGAINAQTLIKAGLIRDLSRDLKILGDMGEGSLNVKLDVSAHRVSAQARKLIEGAGGKVVETGTRRDKVRGVDRNAEDKTPKNLTKKLNRTSGAKKPVEIADPEEGDKKAKDKKPKEGKDGAEAKEGKAPKESKEPKEPKEPKGG